MARISPLRPSRLRPTERHTQFEYGETYLMGQAARRFFVDGLSQKEVAAELRVSQATVSRLLSRARDEEIIKFTLLPGMEHGLAHELQEKFKETCVKRFVVVPGGSGINEGNLAAPAAALVLQDLAEIAHDDVKITASGGRTIHAVFESLIRALKPSPDWNQRGRTLNFYPAVLGNDHWIDLSYPATLATTLALNVNRAFGGNYGQENLADEMGANVEIDRRVHIRACAPSLPVNFYRLSDTERADYLKRYLIKDIIEEALSADMFVFGIGSAVGKRYREILGKMNKAQMFDRLDGAAAEICWVPIDAAGKPLPEIADYLVAVKPDELRERARNRDLRVIAVAGGVTKVDAIEAAMIDPCFSTLVTDVVNARRLMRSEKVGKQK